MNNNFTSTKNIQTDDALIRFIMDKKWNWLKHTLLISLVILNFLPFSNIEANENITQSIVNELNASINKLFIGMIVYCLIVIYLNAYYLVPKLLFKKRYVIYFSFIVTFSVGFYFASIALQNLLVSKKMLDTYLPITGLEEFASSFTIPFVFLMAISGYKIFKKWIADSKTLNELQQSQLQTELTNLKNQVNPHFLFNTLNNIRTLNTIDVEKSNQVLLGLSDILRYQIYDSNKELTTLTKDIDMLHQYLMLEKTRRDDFKYEIVVEGNTDNINIPPLLFINFIENAIKHGASSRESSFCNVKFIISKSQLYFSCINSKPTFVVKSEMGGVGLKNIERRLELLYENKYDLQLNDSTNLFSVVLNLPL